MTKKEYGAFLFEGLKRERQEQERQRQLLEQEMREQEEQKMEQMVKKNRSDIVQQAGVRLASRERIIQAQA